MDSSQGSIRTPIETDLDFQRAFSGPFDRLPLREECTNATTLGLFGIAGINIM